MYIVKRAVEEKEYVSLGTYEKVIIYNPNSPYLFKTRPTKRTLTGLEPLRTSGFRGRMQKIKSELQDDSIILSNLILSNVVDKVIDYQNELGRELTQSELRYYLKDEFGLTKNLYDIRKMTRQKLNKLV